MAGYSPFIGSGFNQDSWSFCVNLRQAEEKNISIKNINVIDLYEKIEENLKNLDIENALFIDHLLINGTDVISHDRILSIDNEYIKNNINTNNKKERYYKAMYIPMWNGQVIINMYYRFVKINGNLFTEANFLLLPPIKEKYRDILNIPIKEKIRTKISIFTLSLLIATYSWILVYFKLFSYFNSESDQTKNKNWLEELESKRFGSPAFRQCWYVILFANKQPIWEAK